MEQFIIKGGKPISGEITLRGAKNAIGNLLVATLLTDEECVLTNVPRNKETEIALEICRIVGSEVAYMQDTIRIQTSHIKNPTVKELSRKNRISILALAPLLVRTGEAHVPVVGGDRIGPRPVDFHIEALRKMGAEISFDDSLYSAKTAGLTGQEIYFPYPSVGATQTVLLAAVCAAGHTTIHNAAVEPEVKELIRLLQNMGAIIQWETDRRIRIEGVLHLKGVSHRLLPDRLEAASFAIMAIATNGEVFVREAVQDHLLAFLNALRRIGGDYRVEEGGIRFYRNGALNGVVIETDTHPGFMTDWQQPMAVLMTQAEGRSIIHETVYEDRFGYIEDLKRMGANAQIAKDCLGALPCRFKGKGYNHSCIITGPTPLHGAHIAVPDIRAGMAHVIAALVAEGESVLSGIEHLDRGYESLDERLRSLGADIQRVGV
ncbi:MAG: UDP-N-acetylglucosamine 1-carboxyvinyltransferase [bacterium]|nr:UDP-N-acetylglucosamine 1-carboxyvinyltransferase [bacterium]